jgi:hypothetical protein
LLFLRGCRPRRPPFFWLVRPSSRHRSCAFPYNNNRPPPSPSSDLRVSLSLSLSLSPDPPLRSRRTHAPCEQWRTRSLPGCGKPSPASVRSGEVVITHFRSRADQQPWLISLTRSLLDPLLSSPPLLHLFIHVCVCVCSSSLVCSDNEKSGFLSLVARYLR